MAERTFTLEEAKSLLPVLESLLFAACLENARPAAAELVFEKLKPSFFDWNEVRVSTVKELAESLKEASRSAMRTQFRP